MSESNLKSRLMKHEGFSEKLYKDTRGFTTIGFGHNCDAHGDAEIFANGISRGSAEVLLDSDIEKCAADVAARLPWFRKLDPVRQDVVLEMVFNMGFAKFLEFKNTIEFIQGGQYFAAANEMLNSNWAIEVKDRAHELADMMEWGLYPPGAKA